METKTFVAIGLSCALLVIVLAFSQYNPNTSNAAPQSATYNQEQVSAPSNSQVDKALLVTACELAIKPQLKNPKSFDVDMHQTQVYDHEGKLVLDMFYYAENSYGANTINEVFCDFTPRGTLISIMHT